VLGIERYSIAHTQGSHHGQTRITRQAYLEGAAYVPLLQRSFDLYGVLEQETHQVNGIEQTTCGAVLQGHNLHCTPPHMAEDTACGVCPFCTATYGQLWLEMGGG
jgi:glycine/D-amino acid oxidase-like deaminating enzyme